MDLEIYRDYEEFDREFDRKYHETQEHVKTVASDFVEIGYLLKRAIDTDVLCGSGYQNIYEYAEEKYSIDKSRVSRFIQINDRFSEGGYSRILKEQYKDFGWSKLAIMLQLPEEINEELTPALSKTEIQAVKEEVDAERDISDIEIMLEEKDERIEQEDTLLDKFMVKLQHDEPELFLEMMCKWNGEGENLVNHLAPAGSAIYNVRIPGTGRIMMAVNESLPDVTLTNVRTGEKEIFPKMALAVYMGANMKEKDAIQLWEKNFGETWPVKEAPKTTEKAAGPKKESKSKSKVTKAKVKKAEVAPVQQNPERQQDTEPEINEDIEKASEAAEPEEKENIEAQSQPEEVEVVSGEVENASDLETIRTEGEFESKPVTESSQLEEEAPANEESKRAPMPKSIYEPRMEQYKEMYDDAIKAAGERITSKQFAIAIQEIEAARKAIEYMKELQDKYEEGQDE